MSLKGLIIMLEADWASKESNSQIRHDFTLVKIDYMEFLPTF